MPFSSVQSTTTYRADIDGLRAIAVLAVLVYHAFPTALSGGFVGVDVFFVISGFLISRHILEELAASSFNIRTFYARRVRRIFPALILVMLACLLVGWVSFTPGEYERLGRHVFAGALFLANFLSWREAGYFDTAADTKPLLHLWSLGIEEQFYIVWPLLLALLWRMRRLLSWGMAGLIAMSLAWSLYSVRHDPVADFYSPLTRFWELAMGAMLAWLAQRRAPLPWSSAGASWLGLALLVVALLLIDSHMLFPGVWALLPTLGAALLIQAGSQAPVNRHLLAWQPMVWVGLISYPLYLWHWPLLTFARIIEGETPTVAVRVVLLALSVVLAWLTYRYIERPVRSQTRSRGLIWMLCLLMSVVGVAGFVVKSAHGYKHRLSGMLNGQADSMVLGEDRGRLLPGCGIVDAKARGLTYCVHSSSPDAQFALLGDSKAEAMFYGLVRESDRASSWLLIGSVYPPQREGSSTATPLQQKYRLAYDSVAGNPAVKVVLITVAMRAIYPLDPATGLIAADATLARDKIESYSRAIDDLERAGKRVVFVMDHPTFPDPTSCVSGGLTRSEFLNQFLRRKENPYCTLRYSDHLAGTRLYQEFVAELKRRQPGLLVFDPAPLLCDTEQDQCPMTRAGNFLYSYGDHLSDTSNSMLALQLWPQIARLVGEPVRQPR